MRPCDARKIRFEIVACGHSGSDAVLVGDRVHPGCLRPGAKILMPSARNTASNELVNWPARSPIRNFTAVARCPSSIETLCVHAPSGLAVMSARRTRGVPIRSRSGVKAGGSTVSTWAKSAARMLRGLGGQELLSDGPGAAGVGPIPVSCMICHTVDAAIRWPSLTSSSCTRRCTMRDYRSRCGSPAGGSRPPWTAARTSAAHLIPTCV